MGQRKNIDDLLKDKLGGYTETPPPAVWDALDKRLDQAPAPKPGMSFGRGKYVAAIAALVVLSIFVAMKMTGDNASNIIAANSSDASQQTTDAHKAGAAQHTPGTGSTTTDQQQRAIIERTNNTDNQQTTNDPTTNEQQLGIGNSTSNDQDNRQATNNREAINNRQKNTTNKIAGNNKNTDHRNRVYGSSIPNFTGTEHPYSSEPEEQETKQNSKAGVYNSGKGQQNSVAVNDNTTDNTTTKQNEQEAPQPPAPAPTPNPTKNEEGRLTNNRENPPSKLQKSKYTHFEAGIKGGYEAGFNNNSAQKGVLAGYAQYKISPRLAIMLQPAIKAASLSNRNVGNARSYYKVNNDGKSVRLDSNYAHIGNDSVWIWHDMYTQSHDSIVKTNVAGGTYVEIEVPVLLKYYVRKNLSIYGGVNIAYSKLMGITEQTYNSKPITKTVFEKGVSANNQPPAPLQSVNTEITYTGTPYSAYTGPQYPAANGSALRVGYMFGASYEFTNKWLIDALVQQGMQKANVQGGYNTNAPISAPYVRLTLGYKLTK